MRGHMLRGSESQKLNKRYLHCQKSTKDVENVISSHYLVEFLSFLRFVCYEVEKYKDRNDVNDERVTSPRSNHVEIRQG